MPVEKQVLSIFAGVNGFLDDLPLDQIRAFENGLQSFVDNGSPQLLAEIREKKEISDDLKKKLLSTIGEFKKRFVEENRK